MAWKLYSAHLVKLAMYLAPVIFPKLTRLAIIGILLIFQPLINMILLAMLLVTGFLSKILMA